MCLSIKRFSKSKPDLAETTGSSGTSPETVRTKQQQQMGHLTQKSANFRTRKNQKRKNGMKREREREEQREKADLRSSLQERESQGFRDFWFSSSSSSSRSESEKGEKQSKAREFVRPYTNLSLLHFACTLQATWLWDFSLMGLNFVTGPFLLFLGQTAQQWTKSRIYWPRPHKHLFFFSFFSLFIFVFNIVILLPLNYVLKKKKKKLTNTD